MGLDDLAHGGLRVALERLRDLVPQGGQGLRSGLGIAHLPLDAHPLGVDLGHQGLQLRLLGSDLIAVGGLDLRAEAVEGSPGAGDQPPLDGLERRLWVLGLDLSQRALDLLKALLGLGELAPGLLQLGAVVLLHLPHEGQGPSSDLLDGLALELVEHGQRQGLRLLDGPLHRGPGLGGEGLGVALGLVDEALDVGSHRLDVVPKPLLGVGHQIGELSDHGVDEAGDVILDGLGQALELGLHPGHEAGDVGLRRLEELDAGVLERLQGLLDRGLGGLDVAPALVVDQGLDLVADLLEQADKLVALADQAHGDLRSELHGQPDDLARGGLGLGHQLGTLGLHLRHVGVHLSLELGDEGLALLLHRRRDLLDGLLPLLADVGDNGGVLFVVVVDEVFLGLGVGLLAHDLQLAGLFLGLLLQLALEPLDLVVELHPHVIDGEVYALVGGLKAGLNRLPGGDEDLVGGPLHLVQGLLNEAQRLGQHLIDGAHQHVSGVGDQLQAAVHEAGDGLVRRLHPAVDHGLEVVQGLLGGGHGGGRRLGEGGVHLHHDAVDGLGDLIRQGLGGLLHLVEGGVHQISGLLLQAVEGALEALHRLLDGLGGAAADVGHHAVEDVPGLLEARLAVEGVGEHGLELAAEALKLAGEDLGGLVDEALEGAELLARRLQGGVLGRSEGAGHGLYLGLGLGPERLDLAPDGADHLILDGGELIAHLLHHVAGGGEDLIGGLAGDVLHLGDEALELGTQGHDRAVDGRNDLVPGAIHHAGEGGELLLGLIDDGVGLLLDAG